MAVISLDFKKVKNLTKKEFEKVLTFIGIPIESIENDIYFLEITPNRPDLLSSHGILRAIDSYINRKNKDYNTNEIFSKVLVEESIKGIRDYVSFAYVYNLNLTEEDITELMTLQEKLHDTIGRKRKKIAIGIHDAKNIKMPLRIYANELKKESFVPLSKNKLMNLKEILTEHEKGIKYSHLVKEKGILIKDSNGEIISFPPIINSNLTLVTKNTKEILIDVTGTHKQTTEKICSILCCFFSDLGGKIKKMKLDYKDKQEITPNLEKRKHKIDYNFINKILGLNLTKKQICFNLEKMGYEIKNDYCLIPCFRTDVLGDIDLAEDVAIGYGFENFNPVIPKISTFSKKYDDFLTLKNIFVGMGFSEIISYHLTNKKDMEKLNINEDILEIENPLTTEFTIFRPTLIHSIIKTISENQNKKLPIKIFEVGLVIRNQTYFYDLCCGVCDFSVSYSDILAEFRLFCKEYDLDFSLKADKNELFIEGRCAKILCLEKEVGYIGEINPVILEKFGCKTPICIFNLNLRQDKKIEFEDNF